MEETTAEAQADFSQLLRVVERLRGKQGCPWDKKQSPQTLKRYLLEECHELIEAIDLQHQEDVCEEIGDVLFLLAFLISIYSEQGHFSTTDTFRGIISKMIRRHPHVFAGQPVNDEHQLQAQWQRIKAQEKGRVVPE